MEDTEISGLIEGYRVAIKDTWSAMSEAGVSAQCMDCAINDGGSCCGRGIEDRFDATLLLINLFMGIRLPTARFDQTGCMFLGERGCLIAARHLICVNYICKRLNERIAKDAIMRVKEKIGREAVAGFALEEALKKWLIGHGF
ncbi:MAG: hypothetical protein ACP5SG_05120 [Dissulfurimicrobium sp.]|uniref:hypothetical protein n=1 Tax=Dissulfurimicrobium hydrothermale TaxID=1750598 RepID=UPI001EDB6ECB|nr:hypothetical protein [Dissulfurimicrobium hydrothermale]UKL14443.1 hypothetical protein LGS26_04185 [Dissulfurimicrobium hydrothermale]